MSTPIKNKILLAIKRLEKIDLSFETQVMKDKSALENSVTLEIVCEAIQDEIKRCSDAYAELSSAQDIWADLLRKMPPDEREEGEKESSKFYNSENIVKKIEQADGQFKKLKLLQQKIGICLRLVQTQYQAEKMATERQAQIAHAQALAAFGTAAAEPTTTTAQYNLPTLHLRKFSGSREEWPEFWESYRSAVHSRSLEDSEKLNYLRNFLEGEARKIIEGLPLINVNYSVAIQLLRDQYGDEEVYQRILYNKLGELPTCRNFEDVKNLHIELERIYRQLEAAGEKIQDPSVYIPLERKLTPKILREVLKQKAADTTAWTTKKFKNALAKIIQEEEAIQSVLREATCERKRKEPEKTNKRLSDSEVSYTMGAVEKPNTKARKPQNAAKTLIRAEAQLQVSDKAIPRRPCIFCDKMHWDTDCSLLLDERKAALREKKICFKCLSKGHFANSCQRSVKCRNCGRSHPTALCGENNQEVNANDEEKAKAEPEITCSAQSGKKALLMTTRVTVFNPRQPRKSAVASVFIDGGSHRSFVNKALADQLDLPVLTTEECYLAGFGEKTAKQYICPLVQLGMLTETGDKMIYPLNSLEFIVQKMPIVELSKIEEQDLQMRRLDFNSKAEQPQVLLGIDVFNELNIRPLEKLPSGFTVSNSKLGKILSGEGSFKSSHKKGSFPAISFGQKEALLTGAVLYDSEDGLDYYSDVDERWSNTEDDYSDLEDPFEIVEALPEIRSPIPVSTSFRRMTRVQAEIAEATNEESPPATAEANMGFTALLMRTPPSPASTPIYTRLIAPTPKPLKPIRDLSRSGFEKRVSNEVKQLLGRQNIATHSTPAKKLAKEMKLKLAGPSPKKAALRRLTCEEDMLLCIKSGISWNQRKILKRELALKALDVFSGTTVLEKRRWEVSGQADLQWTGSGQTRALLCLNISHVMGNRINALRASGKLLSRSAEDSISIVLTGDKGGADGSTKIGLLVADVAKPNSPSNVTLVAFFVGDDNRQNLERRLGPIWQQLAQMNSLSGLSVDLMICGDYNKYLMAMFGHKGATSHHPCLLCNARKPLPAIPADPRVGFVPGQYSIKEPPILAIHPDNIIPPSFHILHGLGQRILDLVEQNVENSGHVEQLEAWLRAAKCRRRKRAQNYTGAEIHRLLTLPNPDAMARLITDQNLSDVLLQLAWLLRDIATLSRASSMTPEEIDRLEQKARRFYSLWVALGEMAPSTHVTPKLHLMTAHLAAFARRRGWFAAVSEQAVEHLHCRFNALEKRFRNTGSAEATARQMLRHHILANHLHDRGMDPLERGTEEAGDEHVEEGEGPGDEQWVEEGEGPGDEQWVEEGEEVGDEQWVEEEQEAMQWEVEEGEEVVDEHGEENVNAPSCSYSHRH